MKCPFCAEENTKVIDSRPADDNNSIRRRRQCEKCGKRLQLMRSWRRFLLLS